LSRITRIADWPLPWKVLALLLLVSTIPLAAATAFTFRDARHQTRKDAESLLAARADQIGGQIDAFHNAYLATIERMGRSFTLREFAETRSEGPAHLRAQAALDNILDTDPDVHGVALVGTDGVIFADTDPDAVGRSVGFRAYFAEGRAGRRGVTDPFETLVTRVGEKVFAYYGPLRDARSEVIAVVVLYVRAEALIDRLRRAHGLAGPGSRVVLYDSVGVRIGHSAPGPVDLRPVGPLAPEVVDAMVKDRRFGGRTREILENPIDAPEERRRVFGPPDRAPFLEIDPVNGEEVLAVALRLQVKPWTLFTFVPLKSVELPSARLVGRSLGLGAVLMVVALAVGLFLSGWILRPVRPLTEALDRVAAGDLAARVVVERSDALGRLADGFNRMAEALATSRDELEHRVEERTRDLAEAMKQLEGKNREVERATRLKTEFLANMSHELRTPLNSVIGFSELLGEDLEGKVPEEQLRQVREIHASGRYLLGLINDVLDLARIEAGRLSLDLEDVDVLVAARDAVRTLEPAARLKRIELRVVVETERAVCADQRRLRQILLNLLSNAVKFSPAGDLVELVARDEGPDVRFEVRDHGPGIDPEAVENIFRPFVQGESPLVKKNEGAGLGLAIVRSLVEEHRGRVGVETAPGRGATFWFTLSAVDAPGALGTLPDDGAAVAASRPSRGGPTVLVVEDDRSSAELMRAYLEGAGYRVELAAGASRALELARRGHPSCIVLDMLLGADDGFDVLRRLKSDPATRRIPVLVVSVMTQREKGLALGAADWFVKPASREALLERIGEVVRLAPGRRLQILAIDDDPNTGDLLRSTLEPAGYRLTWRDSGGAGLAAAFQQRPDLVVVDLVLTDMTGFDVLDRLERDPRTRGIPVIVLTGAELSGPERERLRERVAALAEKGSLTRGALVDLVRRAVDRGPAGDAAGGRTVLVVDDHDANRELARTLVERLGYRARVAPGAAEALEAVRRDPPDLILMDLAMPGLTGFDAARALKVEPATAAIPLVAFTALAMAPDRERAREAGFDDYLVKPVNRDALAAVLKRHLGEAS
jgi:CheY-like chemotaxis protein/signal transduction histidine kinase